ncbi:MAG: N-acetyltransferase family protein, partial [Candidatus Sericytochromatia bacterium]
AGKSDLPRVTAMMQAYYALDGLVYTPEVEAAVGELLNRPDDGRVWLVQHQDRTVGYAVVTFWYSLEFRGQAAFLDEIYLEAEARGSGFGGEVIEALAGFCRGLGVRTLRLEVEHENTRAQKAYQKAEFITHPRHLMTKWL